MYHKQLVIHASDKLKAGLSQEDVVVELRRDGWSDADIHEALYYAHYPEKLKKFSLWRLFRKEISVGVAAGVVVLVMLATSVGLAFFREQTVDTVHLAATPYAEAVTFSYGEQPALSDPDFFGRVKQQFLVERAKFIEADLSDMKLRVYDRGEKVLEVPIDTKGKEGSWWETPAGIYKINSKEKTHFSSMGHVYMPWSLNFQGNFFIHGRTYYPDGRLTSAQYTGGCIRLSTDDAEKVYSLVDVGTPVLVFEHSFTPDAFTYPDRGPSLSAGSYMAADILNNHVFADKEASKPVPIASLTKLMTALIATEYINLDNVVVVSRDVIATTSKPRLKEGEQFTVYQLLFPLLMESSNEAAEAIARSFGREEFVRRMNEKALAIGMQNTHFADASGVSSENISTASDLFMLAKYIYNNRSFILHLSAGDIEQSAYVSPPFADLKNLNDFADNEFYIGGKVGKTTAAREASISVFEFPISTGKRPVVIIVLNSPDRLKDGESLLRYTLEHFR